MCAVVKTWYCMLDFVIHPTIAILVYNGPIYAYKGIDDYPPVWENQPKF